MPKFTFYCIGGKAEQLIKPGSKKLVAIEIEAANVDAAYDLAEPQIPEGAKIWSWTGPSEKLDNPK